MASRVGKPTKTTKSRAKTPSAGTSAKAGAPKASKTATSKTSKAARKTTDAVAAVAGDLTGRKAPAFTLPDQNGRPVSLASLTAGANLVLYFYPKDMTPGCTAEACSFRDNLGAVRALGAQVAGVSADSAGSHQKFIERQSLNFPLLSDPDNTVTRAYGVYRMKSLYGRQFMGIERTTFIIGRDGLVKRVFPKVKVNGHVEQVLAALKELG